MHKKMLSGLFLALIAVPAFAAAPAFEKIDVDQDGSISHSEATKVGISDELFTQFNLDKDTKLSKDEYQALVEKHG